METWGQGSLALLLAQMSSFLLPLLLCFAHYKYLKEAPSFGQPTSVTVSSSSCGKMLSEHREWGSLGGGNKWLGWDTDKPLCTNQMKPQIYSYLLNPVMCNAKYKMLTYWICFASSGIPCCSWSLFVATMFLESTDDRCKYMKKLVKSVNVCFISFIHSLSKLIIATAVISGVMHITLHRENCWPLEGFVCGSACFLGGWDGREGAWLGCLLQYCLLFAFCLQGGHYLVRWNAIKHSSSWVSVSLWRGFEKENEMENLF